MIGTVQLILRHCPFLSLCGNWPGVIDIFSFISVSVNLLSNFVTDSSIKSAVPRNIFIFNCTLDAKPFKLHRCTCERARTFAKFQLKSYEDVLEMSKSFFKHHTVFPLTLAVANIYDRTTITQ